MSEMPGVESFLFFLNYLSKEFPVSFESDQMQIILTKPHHLIGKEF
jgi:hypothetical protein